MLERHEFGTRMAVLVAAVGRELTEKQSNVWYDALKDLTRDQLERGITGVIQHYKFSGFPPIAVFREYAIGQQTLTGQDRAIAAWDAVRTELSRTGGYRSVDFDDPVINAAIRSLGGWVRLTETETSQIHWKRAEFIETYRVLAVAGIRGEMGAPLQGIIAISNSREGHAPDGSEGPARIATGLPPQRPGIVRAVPAVGPEVKTIAAPVRRIAIRTAVPDLGPDSEPESMTDEEMAAAANTLGRFPVQRHHAAENERRAKQIARLKAKEEADATPPPTG